MLPAELGLESGLWQMLVHKRSPGWTVRELVATCRPLMDGGKLALYFAHDAEDKLRRFVLERPWYFRYDADQDTVSLADDSASAAVDRWLVKYLALFIQAEDGFLSIEDEAFARHMSVAPTCMADHLVLMYGGSLEVFLRAHPREFTIDDERDSVVWVTLSFQRRSVAASWEEEDLVLFFVDLLQKIGATRDSPCEMHTLIEYLPFMSGEERTLLDVGYRGYLNVFFVLYPDHFETEAEKGCVFLKNSDLHYGEALFLKQQIQIQSRFFFGPSSNMSVVELTLRAKYSTSPVAPLFSGVKSAVGRVTEIVQQHPAIFHVDVRGEEAWLRRENPPWPEGEWNADTELLAVAYFIDILQHIGATSPSRAICFNYIIRAAGTAPPSCNEFLKNVYPALEVIGLFHLHPDIFDLSSVNRVSLKATQEATSRGEVSPEGAAAESNFDRVEEQVVGYVAKLLKFVRDLDPELLTMCAEKAPLEVRYYCMASVESRLQSAIERGRAALSRQEAQLLGPVPPSVSERTTSEASTQTRNEPDLRPAACEPKKEDEAARRDATKAEGQTTCGPVPSANNKRPKKESVAASLARTAAACGGSVARALPGKAKPKVAPEAIHDKGGAPSGDGPAVQPVTCELEKKDEAGRGNENAGGQRSCGAVASGGKERKRESVAATLAKTVSACAVRPTLPAKSQPVTREPEKRKAAEDVDTAQTESRKPRDAAVPGRREAKKESVAACLANAAAAHRLCLSRSQPEKEAATVAVQAKSSEKRQPPSGPSEPGRKNKGAELLAVLDRLAAALPKKSDSEARANQSQVSDKSDVDNCKGESAISTEEPEVAASERERL